MWGMNHGPMGRGSQMPFGRAYGSPRGYRQAAHPMADPFVSAFGNDRARTTNMKRGHTKKAEVAQPDYEAAAKDVREEAAEVPEPTAEEVTAQTAAEHTAAKENEGDLILEAEAIVEDAATAAAASADAAAAAGASEEGATTAELEAARAEAADWQDRYMRLHAEWDTYRRRTSEERAEEKTRATQKLIEDLLPVLDDFERTVDYATENGETGLLDGVKAVQSKLIDALVKDGLTVLDPVGEPYDALEAQAVATVPDQEAYDETVKDVYQKGYKLGNKVIRPAMVTVTTGGPARPKDEE